MRTTARETGPRRHEDTKTHEEDGATGPRSGPRERRSRRKCKPDRISGLDLRRLLRSRAGWLRQPSVALSSALSAVSAFSAVDAKSRRIMPLQIREPAGAVAEAVHLR